MDSTIISITNFRRNAGNYLDQLELGNSFTIIRDSAPVAKLVPVTNQPSASTLAQDLAKIKKLAGGFKLGKGRTPKQMNQDYDRMYDQMLPR